MNPFEAGVLGIIALILLMSLRMPIAVAMALVGFLGFSCVVSAEAAVRVVAKDFYNS